MGKERLLLRNWIVLHGAAGLSCLVHEAKVSTAAVAVMERARYERLGILSDGLLQLSTGVTVHGSTGILTRLKSCLLQMLLCFATLLRASPILSRLHVVKLHAIVDAARVIVENGRLHLSYVSHLIRRHRLRDGWIVAASLARQQSLSRARRV